MTTTNEMDDSYANDAGMSAATTPEVVAITTDTDNPDATIAIGSPAAAPAETIYITADSISPVFMDGGATSITAFDVVFSISIYGDGNSQAYKVVKRIGIDKQKMADEARQTTPVSIVEEKKPEQFKVSKAQLLALAGLK